MPNNIIPPLLDMISHTSKIGITTMQTLCRILAISLRRNIPNKKRGGAIKSKYPKGPILNCDQPDARMDQAIEINIKEKTTTSIQSVTIKAMSLLLS
jgi:hypothetical protein